MADSNITKRALALAMKELMKTTPFLSLIHISIPYAVTIIGLVIYAVTQLKKAKKKS